MKSLLTLLMLLMVTLTGYSQKGFTIGANFMALNSNIVVQNTWGIGREYDYVPTIKTSYGIDVGYNLSDHVGITTGYWFTDLGQKYEDSYSGSEWERSLELNYTMIPVMIRFNGTKSKVNIVGAAGVLLASLKDAEQEWLQDGNQYSQMIYNPIAMEDFDVGATDVTERFNESDIFINLEIGARFALGEKLYLDGTLNFAYGLKDINAPDWQIADADGEYDASHNAFGGIKLGLAYVLFGD